MTSLIVLLFLLRIPICVGILCETRALGLSRKGSRSATTASQHQEGAVDDSPPTAVATAQQESDEGPAFDMRAPSQNLTMVVNETAHMKCMVKRLEKNPVRVSWIRKRDHHVLTSGIITYTSDERIHVLHPPDSDEWTLAIRLLQTNDSGLYECQISTEPKMGYTFRLNVVEAYARILGPAEIHVQTGNTIRLSCAVHTTSGDLELPSVRWGRRSNSSGDVLPPSREGRLKVYSSRADGGVFETMVISKVNPGDSGTYVCTPSRGRSSSVQINVLTDERPAAMQQDSSGGGGGGRSGQRAAVSPLPFLLLLPLFLLTGWRTRRRCGAF